MKRITVLIPLLAFLLVVPVLLQVHDTSMAKSRDCTPQEDLYNNMPDGEEGGGIEDPECVAPAGVGNTSPCCGNNKVRIEHNDGSTTCVGCWALALSFGGLVYFTNGGDLVSGIVVGGLTLFTCRLSC